MNRITMATLSGVVYSWAATATLADVGVTDVCQDDVKELEKRLTITKMTTRRNRAERQAAN